MTVTEYHRYHEYVSSFGIVASGSSSLSGPLCTHIRVRVGDHSHVFLAVILSLSDTKPPTYRRHHLSASLLLRVLLVVFVGGGGCLSVCVFGVCARPRARVLMYVNVGFVCRCFAS